MGVWHGDRGSAGVAEVSRTSRSRVTKRKMTHVVLHPTAGNSKGSTAVLLSLDHAVIVHITIDKGRDARRPSFRSAPLPCQSTRSVSRMVSEAKEPPVASVKEKQAADMPSSSDDRSILAMDRSLLDDPRVNPVEAPATAPSNYQVVTESCDWCFAEMPWDGEEDEEFIRSAMRPKQIERHPHEPRAVPRVTAKPPALSMPPTQSSKKARKAIGIRVM